MDEKEILLNVIQEQAVANANQLIQIKALEAKIKELQEPEQTEELPQEAVAAEK